MRSHTKKASFMSGGCVNGNAHSCTLEWTRKAAHLCVFECLNAHMAQRPAMAFTPHLRSKNPDVFLSVFVHEHTNIYTLYIRVCACVCEKAYLFYGNSSPFNVLRLFVDRRRRLASTNITRVYVCEGPN